MGADFNFYKLQSKTASTAKTEFAKIKKQAQYDHGHSGYSGTFAECPGFTMTKQVFKDADQAEDWLVDNAQKWEDALGVKVGDDIYIGAWCSS